MSKRLLVTGGAGFIGSALVRHLIRNTDHHVLNVDKLTYAGNLETIAEVAAEPRYSFEQVDVADRPGVLAQIAQVLGDGQISIAAVLQKDTQPETESAEIVITTHPAREASMQKALLAIAGLSQVRRVSNTLRIEE